MKGWFSKSLAWVVCSSAMNAEGANDCSGVVAGTSGNFLSVFGVPHIPAAGVQLPTQFITFLPLIGKPGDAARFEQRVDIGWQCDRFFGIQRQNSIDLFPPLQPPVRHFGVEFTRVHRAIGFANGFAQNTERAGNIEFVVERQLKILGWCGTSSLS